jgi:transcriptional regulator with XRE-family HTH domain
MWKGNGKENKYKIKQGGGKMYLSQNLKYLREKKGMSQDELGEELGVIKQTISSWENSKANPSIETIVKLAEYFGVSLDELVLKDLTPPKPMQVKNLKYLRTKYDMTQEDMAKLLGFKGKSSYCLIEKGKTELSIEKLMIVSDYFGITLDELIKQDLTERSEKTT